MRARSAVDVGSGVAGLVDPGVGLGGDEGLGVGEKVGCSKSLQPRTSDPTTALEEMMNERRLSFVSAYSEFGQGAQLGGAVFAGGELVMSVVPALKVTHSGRSASAMLPRDQMIPEKGTSGIESGSMLPDGACSTNESNTPVESWKAPIAIRGSLAGGGHTVIVASPPHGRRTAQS
jgi:hypothetical protein